MVAPLVSSAARPLFDALFLRHDVEPQVVAEAATEEMVLELVRSGVGCTVTFAASAAIVAGRGACAVPVSDHPPNVFQILTRTRQVPTPAAQAFRDFVVAHRLT
jgi:DNA-binding transcriptional LysR family regulator